MGEVTRLNWYDLFFVVLLWKDSADAAVQFRLVQADGLPQDGNDALLERKGATCSGDYASGLDDAQDVVCGTVKWDGCSHLTFGDERGYLHVCGKHNWVSLSTALMRVYGAAMEMMDNRFEGEGLRREPMPLDVDWRERKAP